MMETACSRHFVRIGTDQAQASDPLQARAESRRIALPTARACPQQFAFAAREQPAQREVRRWCRALLDDAGNRFGHIRRKRRSGAFGRREQVLEQRAALVHALRDGLSRHTSRSERGQQRKVAVRQPEHVACRSNSNSKLS